jgi:hypothetical protein
MAKEKKKKKGKQEELNDSWKTFSMEMNQRLGDMTTKAGKDLEDQYQIWNDYSKKMTDMMSRFDPEDKKAFGEMQKLWRDYSEKIGGKFVEVMEREASPSRELYKMWTEYSAKMGNQLSELVSETMKEQRDVYELWMDSFGIKDDGKDDAYDAYKDMGKFWMNIWARSKDMMPPMKNGGTDPSANLKEISELWTEAYSKMAKNTINSPDFAKMDGKILNSNLEAIKANNLMMNQYLCAMGLPTKDNLRDIYKKLHDMDRKISEMARTLNSMKK